MKYFRVGPARRLRLPGGAGPPGGERRFGWFCWGLLYHGPRNDLPDRYDPRRVHHAERGFPAPGGRAIATPRGPDGAELPHHGDYLPLPLPEGRTAFVTHGHLWNISSPPPHQPGDVLIHGHTHLHGCSPGGLCVPEPWLRRLAQGGPAGSYMISAKTVLPSSP